MAKYWLFRIAAAVVPLLPMRLARPLFTGIGVLVWLFAGGTRRRAEHNLRHIPALAANTGRLDKAVRGVFITSALNYLDFLRGRQLTDEEIYAGWTTEREDLLDEVMSRGKGVVILGSHFGNFEFASSRLGAIGYRMITPAERIRPEKLFHLFCRLREHHNVHIVPADSRESLREMIEWLRGGGVLLILADRYVLGAGVEVPFFGEPAKIATGPMALALRTGAPIITAFSWRTGPGRSHGFMAPLVWEAAETSEKAASRQFTANGGALASTPTRARAADQTLQALGAFIQQLEEVIAAHPEAWVSALTPVWEAEEKAAIPAEGVQGGGTSSRSIDTAKT